MNIRFRQAAADDAGLLVEIYNASFFSDYRRFGACPGYGKTVGMMEESIRLFEEGTKLSAQCSKLLDEAELKVTQLMQGPDGAPVEQEIPNA